MLRQAVREMEAAIDDSTQQTAKSMANEKMLVKELARNRDQCEVWQSRAEKAVEAGDDGMARNALTRKNEYQSLVQALGDQLEAARNSSRTFQRQLANSSEESNSVFSIHWVSGDAFSMKNPPSGARRRTDMALVNVTSCR